MIKRLGVHSFTYIAAALVLLFATAVEAQHPARLQESSSSLELTYDYVRTNGPPNTCGCFGLNGGSVVYTHSLRASPFSLVGGLTGARTGSVGSQGLSLNLLTYTVGARYLPPIHSRLLEPYAELQLGGVHASGSLANSSSGTGSSIGSAFAMVAGGGMNLQTNHRLALKLIDVSYLLTTFPNGSNNHQNDLRLSGGLIISLCRSKGCVSK